ncbi:glycine/sarcosine/betaine reductase component B subunit [Synergistes jonesii]|uniref:Beta-aspartyl peptidase n=1 Tax=Synergistes jonesii TaxID=2754 RepID=A0A073IT11_9BACT|nr:glycine/sarcosine/betaine reductase component B subunit [Synergistes jonesii]KEJ92596.1 beta-aspartyl peptidase [Synergistes jonesii]OFB63630.1 beta-aspartyl peptidase [Synergistes jonesii]OFB63789.1 beta-aspartyl peptidase [Synergistes jonesii]OFB64320.1 beta-aspartyl peptidase [Synergistes jonesii]OFB67955.1 beta-aspartyl peptidase [Synergistes jonesii]
MRLELHKVHIKGLEFADETRVKDGVLYVNKAEAEALIAEDRNFTKVSVDFARPGEKTRIIPVKDAVEPRVKMGKGNYFPGFAAPMGKAGEGRTLVLDGAAVVTCGPIVAFQEGFIDMSGPAAPYTPFSATYNIVLSVEPVADLEKHLYETSLREAGLKLAVYLARCADEHGAKADEVAVFEKGDTFEESKKYPDLPKVVYVCMNITQGLLHDTYLYACDLRPSMPTLIHPNEVLDGAMVSGNCVSACDKNTTWHHCHNPIVQTLYAHHGKDINFLGVIPTQESTVLAGKIRASQMNLSIAQQLGADGVIVSEEGYGNPDTDLCLNAKNFENAGIKAVLVSDESAGTDGASQSLADATPELTGFISTGNVNEMIEVPAMDKVIGYPESIAVLSGGAAESLRPDGSMYVELQSIIASTAEIGFNKLGCEWI